MSAMLTPDECFLIDKTPSDLVKLIRYRLANPAPGGHRHHLLARSLVRYWSKALGRKITVAQIPVVTVTGPEHYRIHFDSALDYQERGSKGRFAAHGLAASLLSQFADMSEAEWEAHGEVYKEAARIRSADPEYRAKNTAAIQALTQTLEWKSNHKSAMHALHADATFRAKINAATQRSWLEDIERRANHKAAMERLWNETDAHRESQKAAMQKLWAENEEHRENHKTALQALAKNPAWQTANKAAQQKSWAENVSRRANHKAAVQERQPDVIVTYPDGQEERFAGQSEAGVALGVSHRTIGRYLNGQRTPSGQRKGYSFRYAA